MHFSKVPSAIALNFAACAKFATVWDPGWNRGSLRRGTIILFHAVTYFSRKEIAVTARTEMHFWIVCLARSILCMMWNIGTVLANRYTVQEHHANALKMANFSFSIHATALHPSEETFNNTTNVQVTITTKQPIVGPWLLLFHLFLALFPGKLCNKYRSKSTKEAKFSSLFFPFPMPQSGTGSNLLLNNINRVKMFKTNISSPTRHTTWNLFWHNCST